MKINYDKVNNMITIDMSGTKIYTINEYGLDMNKDLLENDCFKMEFKNLYVINISNMRFKSKVKITLEFLKSLWLTNRS